MQATPSCSLSHSSRHHITAMSQISEMDCEEEEQELKKLIGLHRLQ